eukprot:scaffold2890_cov565-Prasinococcus_capsulatus_cf.AAC.1
MAPEQESIEELWRNIESHYKFRRLGHLQNFVGMQFEYDRDERSLKIHQERYTLDVLDRFSMIDCHPKSTPVPTNYDRDPNSAPLDEKDKTLYLQIVG